MNQSGKIEWRESQFGGLEVAPSRISYTNEKLALSEDENQGTYNTNEKLALPAEDAPKGLEVGNGAQHLRRRSSSSMLSNPTPAQAYIIIDANGNQQTVYANSVSSLSTLSRTATGLSIPSTIRSESDTLIRDRDIGGKPLPPRPPLPGEGEEIFGIKRKTFKIFVAGVVIVLLIILAVLLGYFLGVKAKAGSHGPPPPRPQILDNTKLAATNWTDSTGAEISAVFFQHRSNSLMVSMRSSATNEWQTRDLSMNVTNGTNTALDVLPGTPLACTNNRGLWNLYYLDSSNNVAELYASNPAGQWSKGDFKTKIGAMAAEGSRLAALTQMCSNCSRSLLVVWQDTYGNVQMANYTNGNWQKGPTVATSAVLGTGLAITPFTDFRGTGSSGTDTNALRIYHANGSNLIETAMGPETNFQWAAGNGGQPIWQGLSTDPSPAVASISFGNNGWDNNIVTYLSAQGKFMSDVFKGDGWATRAPTLAGDPPEAGPFSSFAMSQNLRMYAYSSGCIHEYKTNASDPFTWVWEGEVADTDTS